MNTFYERSYLFQRKCKAFGNKILFWLMGIIPVKKNKIVVCTFEGKGGFGCNPRYVVEELHRRNADYEIVWIVNDVGKEFPDYVRKVRNTLWNRAYHLSTASVWIDNYRKPYGTRKRKGQLYIQTWHGTICFKTLGLWRGEGFSQIAYLVSKNDSDMADYVVIDSEWCREVYPKGLVYGGAFLKAGSPRCDIMVKNQSEQRRIIRKRYHIHDKASIVMFAPTFREKGQKKKRSVFVGESSLDFKGMLRVLDERFGGEWYLMLRLHPQFAGKLDKYPIQKIKEKVIDVSLADDMCEILAGVDVLITDYSSAAMDASYVGIPVFLYADDLEEYSKDRGGMFWNMQENGEGVITSNKTMTPNIDTVLPFPISRNNEQLFAHIMQFNEKDYKRMLQKFCEDVGLLNDGHASERVADVVETHIKGMR